MWATTETKRRERSNHNQGAFRGKEDNVKWVNSASGFSFNARRRGKGLQEPPEMGTREELKHFEVVVSGTS